MMRANRSELAKVMEIGLFLLCLIALALLQSAPPTPEQPEMPLPVSSLSS